MFFSVEVLFNFLAEEKGTDARTYIQQWADSAEPEMNSDALDGSVCTMEEGCVSCGS
jgi:hypothetical protein